MTAYAANMKCPTWQRRNPPQRMPKATMLYRLTQFNQVVGIDLKWIKDLPDIVEPNFDLWKLPRRLREGPITREEAIALLMALHLRFWHATAPDMIRMCLAMQLHKEVVKLAAGIPLLCLSCRQYARPLHRPMVRASLAVRFNQIVCLPRIRDPHPPRLNLGLSRLGAWELNRFSGPIGI